MRKLPAILKSQRDKRVTKTPQRIDAHTHPFIRLPSAVSAHRDEATKMTTLDDAAGNLS